MSRSESGPSANTGTLGQVTQLLDAVREGRPGAEDDLLEKVQHRLHCMARKMLAKSPTISRWEQTGDVFSQLWMQLRPVLLAEAIHDRRHFFRLATLRMNHLLCDLARRYRGPESFAAHHATGISATAAEAIARTPSSNDGNPHDIRSAGKRGPKPTPSQFMGNPPPGPPTAVILKDDHFLVHELLANLTDDDAELVGLVYYQELTRVEAAEVMNIDESTARRRLKRAERRMGELLRSRREGYR